MRGLAPNDREDLRQLARDSGASRSAEAVLRLAGTSPLPATPAELERFTDWELRRQGHKAVTVWLVELTEAPWRARPAVLRRALVPPREHFVASTSAADLTRAQLAGLHLRRWGRGVAGAPHAIAVLFRRRLARPSSESGTRHR